MLPDPLDPSLEYKLERLPGAHRPGCLERVLRLVAFGGNLVVVLCALALCAIGAVCTYDLMF